MMIFYKTFLDPRDKRNTDGKGEGGACAARQWRDCHRHDMEADIGHASCHWAED